MKASQLIKELQVCIEEHGDLPVHFEGVGTDVRVGTVDVYDELGNSPEKNNTEPFEIYLHQGARVDHKSAKAEGV